MLKKGYPAPNTLVCASSSSRAITPKVDESNACAVQEIADSPIERLPKDRGWTMAHSWKEGWLFPLAPS